MHLGLLGSYFDLVLYCDQTETCDLASRGLNMGWWLTPPATSYAMGQHKTSNFVAFLFIDISSCGNNLACGTYCLLFN